MSLKLNLGAGGQQLAGWVSVDIDPTTHPDVVCDIEDLSDLPDCTVDEIFASHILEHVPYDSPALSEWYRVLKFGGKCTVIVPDIVQVFFLWRKGGKWGPYQLPIDEEYFQASVYGAHLLKGVPELNFGEVGHTHKQLFIFDMLVQKMLQAGFDEVHEIATSDIRPAGIGETMVEGKKLGSHSGCFSDKPYCLRRGDEGS